MSTIINTPTPVIDNTDSGAGVIFGVLIAIIVIGVLFFVYGLPALRDNTAAKNADTNINVTIPLPEPTPSPTTN